MRTIVETTRDAVKDIFKIEYIIDPKDNPFYRAVLASYNELEGTGVDIDGQLDLLDPLNPFIKLTNLLDVELNIPSILSLLNNNNINDDNNNNNNNNNNNMQPFIINSYDYSQLSFLAEDIIINNNNSNNSSGNNNNSNSSSSGNDSNNNHNNNNSNSSGNKKVIGESPGWLDTKLKRKYN